MFNKKINYKRLVGIILVSFGLGIFYNLFSSDSIELIRQKKILTFEEDSSIIARNHTPLDEVYVDSDYKNYSEPKLLKLTQSYSLFEQNKALFIDARDKWDYAEMHIKGAINIPEYNFKPNNSSLEKLSRSDIFIIYCDGDDCDVSKRLAFKLSELGFLKLYVLESGIYEWQAAGYPTESSTVE